MNLYQSVFFDTLRVVAAFAVMFGHGLGHLTEFGRENTYANSGVLIFIIISGFLISKSIGDILKTNGTFLQYIVKRTVRIFIVSIPFTIAYAVATSGSLQTLFQSSQKLDILFSLVLIDPTVYDLKNYFPISRVAWTVAFEYSMYVVIGLICLAPKRKGTHLLLLVASAPFFYAFLKYFDPTYYGFSLIWLMGFVCHSITREKIRKENRFPLFLLLCCITYALSVRHFQIGAVYDFYQASLACFFIGIAFVLLTRDSSIRLLHSRLFIGIASGTRFLAGFTYSLYLFHSIVLMHYEVRGVKFSSVVDLIISYVIPSIGISLMSFYLFERHYRTVTNRLLSCNDPLIFCSGHTFERRTSWV